MRLPADVRREGLATIARSGDRRTQRGARGQVLRLRGQNVVTAIGQAIDDVAYRGHRKVEIREPVFIVAPPRSGTTLLFNLMANDPVFTCMRTYESQLPAVSIDRALRFAGRADRYLGGLLHKVLDRLDAQTAKFEHIHRTRLTEPEEDSGLFLAALAEPTIQMVFPVGHAMDHRWYLDDLPDAERAEIMHWYQSCLRRHLYGKPDKRLLVKNAHLAGRLDTVRRTMPDLKIINIVRHPYQTVPSSVSLLANGYQTMTGVRPDTTAPEWRDVADVTIEYYRRLLELERTAPPGQWCTVRFDDLVRAPLATVERIYDELGLEMSPEARAAIEADAGNSNRHRSSGHGYTPEQFGLTHADIYEPLKEIFDVYGFEP